MLGPPRRFGVDVSVTVARIIQPGSFPAEVAVGVRP
jgi:hypothetical protein